MGELEDLCGRTVGEFVLRERIDEGGFGAVYRCDQPLLGREAVVKVLHQRLRRNDIVLQRFMREAQLASRLDHPYAAHVYAFGIEPDDGLFWIAMEMVQGIALNRWLRDRGPLSLAQLVPFFDRVAEVVQTAHERGIVHRDLKPSNVMVIERAGRLLPKLLDFGIAKLLDEATLPMPPGLPARSPHTNGDLGHADTADRWVNASEVSTLTGTTAPPPPYRDGEQRLTNADATIGSPPYMSPEQWNNAVTVGPASDLYALGVVAYEALTGRRPFTATSIAEYVDLHCNYPVPPLGDGFSPALDRLFQRALAKRPEDRWGTALELATALRAASGFAASPTDVPRLDDAVRDAWLAGAPQPLAESIAALDGARNAHQARDAAQELVRNLLRYLLAVALATRAQVRDDRDDPALLDLVRTLRRRDLDEEQRVRLLRLLVRPLVSRRGAHPVPELVDLVAPRPEDGADGLDPIMALHPTTDHAGSEDLVRERLTRLLPELATLLRRLTFVLDYAVVVPRNDVAERWTGLRRQRRAAATVTAGELVKHHPMLLDREGRVCVDLWPLAQVVSPTEGADPELFLFDGRGRHGARMIAAPAGFEHHDPAVWEWIATRVIADIDANADLGGSDGPPYLGLTPFSTGDSARFVGREAEVDAFVNRLRQRSLQIVVGPSGAGKTSFVHAGVLPALPRSWRTITLHPGAAPIASLAARLAAADLTTTDLRPLLETSPATAAALVAAAAGGTIVIVIDHLEELFTLCTRSEERVQFAQVIAELAALTDGPIRVIGAIRDDFLMDLDALAPLRSLLSPAIVLLGNPTRDALVRIVVEPAAAAGYALSDPELAQDMVSVVADHPGALALLSFTAARLWELRDRRFRQLTRNAYDAMGGIGGALGRHAEDTLDLLSVDEHRLAREIFRHLVTADGTRAHVTSKELRQRLATPRADPVIDKLVAARLLAISDSAGEPQVQVIHDVLINAWPRLQQWIRDDVDDARMRDQLRIAARQWQDRVRSHALLWRGDVLVDLERWLRRPSARALSDLELAFVAASRRFARRASRGRQVFVALVCLLAFGAFAYRAAMQTRLAEQLAEIRETQSYVDQGRHALNDGDSAQALLFLAQAYQRGDRSPSVEFMLARAAQPRLSERVALPAVSGRMWSAMFSPDGAQIVTADDQGARVWNTKTGKLLFTLSHSDLVFQALYSTDGRELVTGSTDGTVKIWNPNTGARVRTLSQQQPGGKPIGYDAVAVSRDGSMVAAAARNNAVAHFWNANTGAFLAELASDSPPLASGLEFSADGRWIAMKASDEVRVFDTVTWKLALAITAPELAHFCFDPTGARMATVTRLGDASIWAIPSGARVRHLLEAGESLGHVAFSRDGALVVTASQEGSERIWQAATGRLQARLNNHRGAVMSVDFDPTSELVVSSGADGVVVVSDVDTGMPVSMLEGPSAPVVAAHFDPSSRWVVGASWDGTARVWDATSPYRQWSSQPIGRDCGTELSPDTDRRFVTVSCTEHGTQIWDTSRHELLAKLPSVTHDSKFNSPFPAVSTEGDLAAIPLGNLVALYRLPGGERVGTVTHLTTVTTVAFAKTGHKLVSGSAGGALLVTRESDEPLVFPSSPDPIDVAAFLPDGRVIAADAGQRLRVYDGENRARLAELALASRIRAVRSSSDSHRLITIPEIGTAAPAALWDVEGYRVIKPLMAHKGQVFSTRFQRDDSEIVTAGTDGVARLWDGLTGRLRRSYFGSKQYLLDTALSPDGAILVTAGGDGVLRFWDASSGAMIWTLRAHKLSISGIHFEGADVVSRGITGEISRWKLPRVVSPGLVEHLVRCLPLRFDEETGGWVDQTPCQVEP